jgi:hypothetical protein
MIVYVVTASRAQFLDYCTQAKLHPSAARLVQSPLDLIDSNLGENRIVFWGDFKHLSKLPAIIDEAKAQIAQDVAKVAIRLPTRRIARSVAARAG